MDPVDPRSKNSVPATTDAGEYLNWYADFLSKALRTVDQDRLRQAVQLVDDASRENRRIWVGGNGGSAAIADHLCCDWTKGTFLSAQPSVSSISLTSNVAMLTALANDFSYEQIFAKQLEMHAKRDDVVLLISSSGNSPNVIAAANKARELGLKTIALTGFSGGALASMADVSLHVSASNYGIVEDCHQSIMHVIAQTLFKVRSARE